MQHNSVFITGTDTNIGKTLVCAWLGLHVKAGYWKPVQTGAPQDCDQRTVSELTDCPIFPQTYTFKAPVSPHLAAAKEGQEIDLSSFTLPQSKNPLIIEGAGGLLVPLNTKETMLDLIQHLQTPLIIVARSTLGTINHSCLTIQRAQSAGIPVLGVILSGPPNQENKDAIEHFGKVPVLAELPWLETVSKNSLENYPLPAPLRSLFRQG